ncbi:MAG TPA: helix-turn-helix transcriptional regulator [Steroidobacteraceae bacterium]|jgi:transcriptional regulator with XRE-family HTH domain|nr:helix-turn-helix transcriptional regulator [Steroidobacteraceae bacterium]
MTPSHQSNAELAAGLGASLRALRLDRNLDQKTVAARAGVSVHALKNLESGKGTLKTLVSVLLALERASWLATIAPMATINPLSLPRAATPRQRAAASKSVRG